MSTTSCIISKPCTSYNHLFASINILRTYSDYCQLLHFSTLRTEYTVLWRKMLGFIFLQIFFKEGEHVKYEA